MHAIEHDPVWEAGQESTISYHVHTMHACCTQVCAMPLLLRDIIIIIIIIYLLILHVLHVQMLTRALQYNNYLTVHTQIRKKNYIVHFITINIEEEKKLKL